MIRLTASDFYTYYRPEPCTSRVYLKHNGEPEGPPSPYEEILIRLGQEHEKNHLASFPEVIDLSSESREERKRRTREEVQKHARVIYQSALEITIIIAGTETSILGDPDFLVLDSGKYIIRDSKISRRINEKDHPEIIHQLQLYGWLFEKAFGIPLFGLEVHNGAGDIVKIPYHGETGVLDSLKEILKIKLMDSKPYSPVGWTRCGNCGYFQNCWPQAEEDSDVAIIRGVDKGLAVALRDADIHTVDELLSSFDEATLADLKRPVGATMRRVGKRASSILQAAQCISSGQEILLQPPDIPESQNFVMFDLEGLPPHLDELDKIYLWGLQVFGKEPGDFMPATAGFGLEGDQEGWERFLSLAESIFERYGDIPFVHWSHYERVQLKKYIDRYGDRDNIAARVDDNLSDLMTITQKSIVLPLPSYGLKVVEDYVGYARTLEKYGGDWAMARYIEATETQDEKLRNEVMEEILAYNREDLEATWAVLSWLKGKQE